MWPILKGLFTDPEAFKRFVRAAVLGAGGGGGLVLATELAASGVDPAVVRWVRLASAACLFIGGLIGVGDRTPPAVKALAEKIGDDAPRGYARLWILLALTIVGLLLACAALRTAGDNLRESVSTCAHQTLDDFRAQDWEQSAKLALEEIDDALRRDWPAAAGVLAAYAGRYGAEFVDCVVARFRAYYAVVAPDAGEGRGGATYALGQGIARGRSNADAWLAGRR